MNTETSLNRFQDLPEDIARIIFEESAADPDIPGWACARVSKKVQAWVEPILYREVIVEDHISISLLHTTVLSHPTKPESFFSLHVRTLCIYSQEYDTADDIISTYFGLEQQGKEETGGLESWAHPSWNRPRLKRLRMPELYFPPSHRHFRFAEGQNLNPIFANITHLELHLYSPVIIPWDWGSFQYLPFLTHFCIMTRQSKPYQEQLPTLRSAVPYFPPSLIVCVFYIPNTISVWLTDFIPLVQENGRKVDERVVVALDEAYYLMLREGHPCSWLEDEATWRPRSVDGVVSERKDYLRAFWERAEAVITRRRREDNLKATVGCGS
ncbi:hypothetical protein DFP72DRAFT_887080 [Ephemerocybe angulata]|uniref:Uncharacterized protein n=1 Tax=Ephemerocybe angulata TaxID=980116 RepID=A0A8H6I6V1_9AGAR|nr:hypothetical protein DFP72DRAFT_887080 [Tulosesus angulatus]